MNVNGDDVSLDGAGSDSFCDNWNPNPSSIEGTDRIEAESLDWMIHKPGSPVYPGDTVERPASPIGVDPSGFALNEPASPRRAEAGGGPRPDVDTATADRARRPIVFPKLGQAIGGFRLVAELGRGAFARVYLAHEVELGNRPVALKVSKAEGDEPQILARLQHTHIVPIHSVRDDPETGLRLICMPYFGGANLAQLLDVASDCASNQTHGRSLVDALDLVGQPLAAARPSPSPRPRRASTSPSSTDGQSTFDGDSHAQPTAAANRSFLGRIPWWPRTRVDDEPDSAEIEANPSQPARQFLRASSYVRASTWIMARLAEGLEHAHSRGLLHRDLKPSNILIAADGTPMLLDFNLATLAAGPSPEEGKKAKLGGTLPYMSPEHLDAFNPRGTTHVDAVDERSDLYALGLILFEMIAGHPAFPDPIAKLALTDLIAVMADERRNGAPSLREANPAVPWSLDAIVAKALDPNPDRRYRSAGELAEDLRRFLDDLPLRFTREPSLRETVVKWARRHPRASSTSTIIPVAASLLLALGVIVWGQAGHLRHVAARLNLRLFRESFQECQFLLNTASGGDLTGHLRQGVEKAQAAIDRYAVAGRGNWDQSFWVASLAPDERSTLRQDLTELVILQARARVTIAEKEGNEDDRRRALGWAVAWLDRVETFDTAPSPALLADRARYHRALGQPDLARRDRKLSDSTPAASCRDEYLLATAALAEGRHDQAEARLNHAVKRDPKRFWAWFALGLCHFDQRRFDAAVGDFNVCTALMPEFAWPFANRGLALARSGRIAEAIDSFDRAIELSPNFADALAGRGLVHLESDRADLAEADLGRALELGSRDPNVRAGHAEAIAKLGRRDEALTLYASLILDRPADARLIAARGMIQLQSDPASAEADFAAALKLDPALATAHYGMARICYRTDITSALSHVDRAIAADPNHLDATQLRALIRARLGRLDAINDVEHLIQAPTANRLYNASCAMAILAATRPDSRHEFRAVELLSRALQAGFPAATAQHDPDLASIRHNPDYRRLVGLNP
jgi:serine/threonine protein kinase/Tfp pilus assembly protein PilF